MATVLARRFVPAQLLSGRNARLTQQSNAAFSSYILDAQPGSSPSSSHWPIRKANTIFNIVPEGHKYVVERFGKLHMVQESGWFLAIPFVDQISYDVDLRERAMDIPPQSAITRDNVSVEVSGNLFVQFVDPERAAYGAFNPLYSVTQVRTLNLHAKCSTAHGLTYYYYYS